MLASKTILGVKAPATFGITLTYASCSFDSADPQAAPVLVELCYCTFATNPPGTNSTSITPALLYGGQSTPGFAAAKSWSAEPTVLSVVDEMLLVANGQPARWRFSPGLQLDSDANQGFAIRVNAGLGTTGVRANLNVERH